MSEGFAVFGRLGFQIRVDLGVFPDFTQAARLERCTPRTHNPSAFSGTF